MQKREKAGEREKEIFPFLGNPLNYQHSSSISCLQKIVQLERTVRPADKERSRFSVGLDASRRNTTVVE